MEWIVFSGLAVLVVSFLAIRLKTEMQDRKIAEEALLANENKFRMAFETSPNALSITTLPGGIYVDVNQCFTQISGYAPEEVIGKSVLELKLWKDESTRDKMLEGLRENGYVKDLEAEFLPKDGREVYGSLSASIVELDGVPHVIVLVRDITAQVLAERKNCDLEEKLKTQEESMRHIVENSTNLFYSHDIENNFTYISPQSFKFFECSPEEAKADWRKFATDNPVNSKALELTRKAIATGEQQPPYEFEIKGKHGKITMVEVRESPVIKDGRTVSIVGSFADITERKRMETILNDEKRFLDDLLKAIPISIGVKNRQGFFLSCNPACAEAVGLSMEDIIGRKNDDIYPADLAELFNNEDKLTIESGESRSFELFAENWRGEQKSYEFLKTPFIGIDGREISVVSVGIDITERKQTEIALIEAQKSAERANKAKSVFLANMSHEIRTPINGLLGVLQLIEISNEQHELNHYVNTALQSTRRLNRLLSDILDLSRVEAGKLSIANEIFGPADVLKEVIQLFEPAAKAKGLRLELVIDPDFPDKLVGDPQRLQQVLSNLVGNALKFTGRGKVALEACKLQPVREGQCRLLFIISDTGMGIPADVQGRLFRAFVQVHDDQDGQFGGTGLGLAISRYITELMGGSMALESEENIGSTFYLNLPFATTGKASVQEPAGQEDYSPAGLRVLLADDDPVSRMVAAALLRKLGCRVRAVEDGRMVLFELQDEPFDVVLMDIQMPELDGPETTRAIRAGEAGAENREIPIIALTACAMAGDSERFFAAGMNGYVEKPIEVKMLCRELQKISGLSAGPLAFVSH